MQTLWWIFTRFQPLDGATVPLKTRYGVSAPPPPSPHDPCTRYASVLAPSSRGAPQQGATQSEARREPTG